MNKTEYLNELDTPRMDNFPFTQSTWCMQKTTRSFQVSKSCFNKNLSEHPSITKNIISDAKLMFENFIELKSLRSKSKTDETQNKKAKCWKINMKSYGKRFG